jgi:hypothetical protein
MTATLNESQLQTANVEKDDGQDQTKGKNETATLDLPVSSLNTIEEQYASQAEKSDGETGSVMDPNIVDWSGPNDPENPLNSTLAFKILNVGLVSALTFLTPLASSMFAPGVPEIMAEFQSTNVLLADFVLSVYVLEFAIGPLILAPSSELYGRAIIYHICNAGFLVFSVACAVSTDLGMLITFRFFQGCFGSAPVTNGTWCFL